MTGERKGDRNSQGDSPEPGPFEDERFGVFEWDPPEFLTDAVWNGSTVELRLDTQTNEAAMAALDVANSLWDDQSAWDDTLTTAAAEEKLELVNDERYPYGPDREEPITREAFARSLSPHVVRVRPDGEFDVWYDDGVMNSGHTIIVYATLADGPVDVALAG